MITNDGKGNNSGYLVERNSHHMKLEAFETANHRQDLIAKIPEIPLKIPYRYRDPDRHQNRMIS